MDVEAFASGVRFRLFEPDALPSREELIRVSGDGIPLDVRNTLLPVAADSVTEQLVALSSMPKMSTFAIGAVINHAVRQMPPGDAFVNIGLWCGFTLLAGMVGNPKKRCIGVDNFSEFSLGTIRGSTTAVDTTSARCRPAVTGPGREVLVELAGFLLTAMIGNHIDESLASRFAGLNGPREVFLALFEHTKSASHSFHEMDYREYFARVHREPIGLYLYDAGHAYVDQLEGLRLAEPFFSEGCIVLVDDTNAADPRNATLAFMNGKSAHRYRLLFDQRTAANGHPTWWNGLMAFQRVR